MPTENGAAAPVRPEQPAQDMLPHRIPGQALCEIEEAHRQADRCDCGLPFGPPRDQDYYWPSIDSPDPQVSTVARYGEHPTYRRAVRVPSGWMKRGVSVDESGRPSAIVAWEQVGHCWADTEHPVVAVNP
ncbi:MAG TPA: hypothetical protein VE196_15040 [Pseudonocardiaceae bacterium]|nr:hypothetical protein [Pseudonocardiaceae bacterium]